MPTAAASVRTSKPVFKTPPPQNLNPDFWDSTAPDGWLPSYEETPPVGSPTDSSSSYEEIPGTNGENVRIPRHFYNETIARAMQASFALTSDVGLGTGFIIGHRRLANGKWQPIVATNAHVVTDDKKKVKQTVRAHYLADLNVQYDATVLGATQFYNQGTPDVALVALGIELDDPSQMPAVVMERSLNNLLLGEPVIAIGSPMGQMGTVTNGVVGYVFEDGTIHTNAEINPGNSGGGLFRMDGTVLGINTWAIRNAEDGRILDGMAYAQFAYSTVMYLLAQNPKLAEGLVMPTPAAVNYNS